MDANNYLFAGLRDLGAGLSAGMEKHASDATKAQSLRKYLSETFKDKKDYYQTLGLGDLEGEAMALADQRRQEAANVDQQEKYARILALQQGLARQGAAAADEAAGNAAVGRGFQAAFNRPPDRIAANPGETMMQAFANAGGADVAKAPQFQAVLQMLAGAQNAGGTAYNVQEGTTSSGTPYVTYGHNFQFDPKATADTRLDSQKELAKYQYDLHAQRDQAALAAGLRPTGIKGIFLGPKGQSVDLRSQMEKLLGDGSATGSTTNAPPAAAATPLKPNRVLTRDEVTGKLR